MRVSTLLFVVTLMLLPFAVMRGRFDGLALLVAVFLTLAVVFRVVEAVSARGRDL